LGGNIVFHLKWHRWKLGNWTKLEIKYVVKKNLGKLEIEEKVPVFNTSNGSIDGYMMAMITLQIPIRLVCQPAL